MSDVISTVLPNDNPKRRVIRKVRNVIWNVIFLGTSSGAFLIMLLKAIILSFTLFKTFTTFYKIIFISLWSIQLFYFIFMCIFVLNNHLEKSRQPWLKCILLSVYYFYNYIPYGITFFVLVPLSSQHNFSILANVINIVNCQFYSSINLARAYIGSLYMSKEFMCVGSLLPWTKRRGFRRQLY